MAPPHKWMRSHKRYFFSEEADSGQILHTQTAFLANT